MGSRLRRFTLLLAIVLLVTAKYAGAQTFFDEFNAPLSATDWATAFTPGAANVYVANGTLILETVPNPGCATALARGTRTFSVVDGTVHFTSRVVDAYVDQGIYGDAQPRGLVSGADRSNAIEFINAFPVPTTVAARTVANGAVTETTVNIGQSVRSPAIYEIVATPTQVEFRVNGAVVATHTTNIPTVPLNAYFSTGDSCFGNVPVVVDWVRIEDQGAVPSVITAAATSVTTTGATLNGTVSSNGASTTVSFQYGLTTSYGSTVTAAQSPLAAGASNAAVSASFTGLACNTLYHFRGVGSNTGGTSYGADLTFTTAACGPTMTPPSGCTLSANPTSLPASGGNVALTMSCASGGAPSSYSWSATPSVTFSGTGAANSASITQSTTFTAAATNAAGSSNQASVTVAVGAAAPPTSPKPTAEQLVGFADAADGHAPPVAGYAEIPVIAAPGATGFSVKAFRATAGDRIVVAFAGTDEPFDLLGTDRSFLDSQPSPTLQAYVAYATNGVRALAAGYPGVELTFTGHSLGGAIALLLGKASGANATAFNAPGAEQLRTALQSTLATLPALPQPQPSGTQELVNYRLYGDLISTLGTPLGTRLTLTPPAPLSTGLIDAAPLEYAKAMHLLSTVRERLDSHAPTTASLGPTAANAQGLLATGAAQGGEMGFAPVAVNANESYFIDPQGVDLYTLFSDPASPRFKSIKFPFLLNTDAVFHLQQLINGVWTEVGTYNEQETGELGALGAEQLRFFVLERTSRRPPITIEPFVFGVRFASAGTLTGKLTAEATVHNYQGMWYAAPAESEAGWGINFAHQGEAIFATWFTHDANGNAWNLSVTALQTGDTTYSGTLVVVTGPPFGAVPFNPAQVHATPVGTATFTFSDGNQGTFAYTVNGITQTKAITRQVFGVLPTCVWGAQANLSLATNYTDMWWVVGGAESGWGINFAHQSNAIFATWFTFDLLGNPLPMSATLFRVGTSNVYSGTLVRTAGPSFSAVPWSPGAVTRAEPGTATVTFANGNRATFNYSVTLNPIAGPVTQTKELERQAFRTPGTVCQ